jgi:tetratricopeptide (TPR) repeat protein
MILFAMVLAACHADAAGSPEAMRRPIPLDWRAGRSHEPASKSPEAQAYHEQGLAYLDSFAWVEAAQSFQEAHRRDSTSALTAVRLAGAYAGAGLARDAAAWLDRANQMAGADARVRPWVAAALLENALGAGKGKQRDRARDEYARALDALAATGPRGLLARGDALGGAGAIRDYRAAAGADPSSPGAHHRLAHALAESGDFGGALEHARHYAKGASGWPHAQHLLAHLLPLAGEWNEARRIAESAAERDAHGLQLLAAHRLRGGELSSSEHLYREACRLGQCAGLLGFLLWSGRVQETLGAAAEARNSSDPLERCAAGTIAGFALIDAPADGDPRKALKSARSRCAAAGTDAGIAVEMLATVIDLRRGKGKKMEAEMLRLADRAAARGSWDRWLFLLDYYSRASLHAGHGEIAAELRRRVRKIDPAFPGR